MAPRVPEIYYNMSKEAGTVENVIRRTLMVGRSCARGKKLEAENGVVTCREAPRTDIRHCGAI